MRECTNCGYKDLLIWRHKHFRLYTDYCHINELSDWDKPLADKIRIEKNCKIGPYIYHLTKAGYVDRVHESDSRNGSSYREAETEKHRCHILIPSQTKL
jgi:hypothetical protein